MDNTVLLIRSVRGGAAGSNDELCDQGSGDEVFINLPSEDLI